MSRPAALREPLVDALKFIASQLIVLHHLAFYGPMADHAAPLMPRLVDALSEHARLAVQVFLVIGGYLAARRWAPQGRVLAPLDLRAGLLDRYLRLVLPLGLTLVLALGAAALARHWMAGHPSVPDAPQPLQLLAHLLLVQDLFGIEALSAGVWYVAIDFQLYAGLLLLLAGCRGLEQRRSRAPFGVAGSARAPAAMLLVVTASALYFNRDPEWDIAAPYFAAAYGLGALAAWARVAPWAWAGGLIAAALGIAAEPRERLMLALVVAGLLWMNEVRAHRTADAAAASPSAPASLVLTRLGQSSYAVFLLHFPVCLVINAAFDQFVPHRPVPQALGLLIAWSSSLAAGLLFHRYAEQPIMRWLSRCRPAATRTRRSLRL